MSTALMRVLSTGGPKVPSVDTPFSKLAKAVLAAGEEEYSGAEDGAPGDDDMGEQGEPESSGDMGEAPPPGEDGGDDESMMMLMQMLEQNPELKHLLLQMLMQGGMGGGDEMGEGMMPGAEPKPEDVLEETMSGAGAGEAPADMAQMGAAPSPMKAAGLNDDEAMKIARSLC